MMPSAPQILAQAADAERWKVVRETFRSGGDPDGSNLTSLAVAVTALTAIFVSMYAVRVVRERHLKSKPLRTFHELANELSLALADQWLLIRIARQQALPSPLTLLMSGRTLTHHAKLYAATVPDRRREKILDRVSAIEQTIFS